MRMLVAAHKAAEVPADDFYMPVHVGHALNPVDLGFQVDDQGENISAFNGSYCELTALYWAMHNLKADAIGLSHYRRYFRGTQAGPNGSKILSGPEAAALMERHDVVLAKPRNYVIETIESHYCNSHYGSDLEAVHRALSTYSPWMLDSWNRILRSRRVSLWNMFLMPYDQFQDCADWLFTILEAAGKEIDNDSRNAYEQRTFGYLSELLIPAYVDARIAPQRTCTLPVVNTEGEPKLRKAWAVVQRKHRSRGGFS